MPWRIGDYQEWETDPSIQDDTTVRRFTLIKSDSQPLTSEQSYIVKCLRWGVLYAVIAGVVLLKCCELTVR